LTKFEFEVVYNDIMVWSMLHSNGLRSWQLKHSRNELNFSNVMIDIFIMLTIANIIYTALSATGTLGPTFHKMNLMR